MTTAQVLILVAIAIYLLFMLWIGWICAKKNESVDDFYLGGPETGSLCHRHERRGQRHVLLAADGSARRGLPAWLRPAGPPSAWWWAPI